MNAADDGNIGNDTGMLCNLDRGYACFLHYFLPFLFTFSIYLHSILFVLMPLQRIVDDILANIMQNFFIPDDMFVLITHTDMTS